MALDEILSGALDLAFVRLPIAHPKLSARTVEVEELLCFACRPPLVSRPASSTVLALVAAGAGVTIPLSSACPVVCNCRGESAQWELCG